MTTLVTSPEDLAVYLNHAVDEDRALMLIGDAQALCEAIVKPLPAGAEAVVRRVAGRAYTNPASVTQETIGPYTVQRTAPGVYLTPGDRRSLRSLAGRSGAFSIDLLPADAMSELPFWDYQSKDTPTP
jgi:hypothetical protein